MAKSIFKSRLRSATSENPVRISLILSGFCETKPIITQAAGSECGSRLPARVTKLHKRSDNNRKNEEHRQDSIAPPPPNIALMDWSELAEDPSELPAWQKALLKKLITEGIKRRSGKAIATAALGYAINFGFDLYFVREFGLTSGQQLANWIYLNSSFGSTPQIDKAKPIHLIGHSAGGFVVGEAATFLKHPSTGNAQVMVDRVTMLDTPFVKRSHIAQGSDNFPNPGVSERYISSYYGNIEYPNTLFLDEHSWYRKRDVFKSWLPTDRLSPLGNGHGYSYNWYTHETIWDTGDPWKRMEKDGFYYSPIINENTRIPNKGIAMASALAPPSIVLQQATLTLPDEVLTTWQVFGNASDTSGTWTLTESDDAGIWANVSVTTTTNTLAFEFHYSNAGDGEEVNTHFTDPNRKDSDGDNHWDSDELRAGTRV